MTTVKTGGRRAGKTVDLSEQLTAYAKKMSDAFAKGDRGIFKLNQPYTLTVKTRTGSYRKHPVIGGDTLQVSSAYMGKTNQLIIVFVPKDPHLASKYGFVEMTSKEARLMLDGFASYMDHVLALDFDEQVEGFKYEAMAEERQSHLEAQTSKYTESFGSW